MTDPGFVVVEGDGPLILSFPHVGTRLPDGIDARLNDRGRLLTDTDWHVDRLYEGLAARATTIRATVHRYVIDLNRDPSGASLYPGRATTELCPTTTFDGRPIWRDGQTPDAGEIAARAGRLHAPYHAALAGQIARVRARWGAAVLYDCHSIRSVVPRLFDGRLPEFSIGTNDGATCAATVERTAFETCAAAEGCTTVLNGRFKGGWTVRRHGAPAEGVHAIQTELAQATHLATEAPPFAYDEAKAGRLRPTLALLLARLDRLARDGALAPGA